MAENSSQSPLNSAFQTAGDLGKFALKKGIDVALTTASGGTSKLLQLGAKSIKALSTLSALGGKKEDKDWFLILIGGGLLLFLIIIVTTTLSSFIQEGVNKIATTFRSGDNFIEVTKTVSPSKIENPDLNPEAVFTYTISITAKEKRLSDIDLSETFTVFKENSSRTLTPVHKELTGIAPLPRKIEEIKPRETKIFGYQIVLHPGLEDSVVSNNLTVKANKVEDSLVSKEVKVSATIVIGSPTGCFTFLGNWTEEEKSLELNAITKLLSNANYSNTLCKNPTKPIELIREQKCDFAHADSKNSKIFITNGSNCSSFRSEEIILYTLIHESGHIYSFRNSDKYRKFVNDVHSPFKEKIFLCSYPLGKRIDEDFPETIAIYLMNQYYPNHLWAGCGNKPINLQTDYPNHYNFIINNHIF